MKETSKFDEKTGKMIVTTTYDNSTILEHNKQLRNAAVEHGRYRKAGPAGLILAGKMDMGDVIRLRNMGYNLLTSDKDERRRALLYIQANEPYLMTIPGKPIAKKKQVWL